ncbi:MAG: twitching motility protein PilT [Acidimicrobiales bacterium]
MSVVYDAGVLVAAERGDRKVWADHRARLEFGLAPMVTAPVVAQVSRSIRQVQLRRLLRGCELIAFPAGAAHEVGALVGASGTSDVVDAHVVMVAAAAKAAVLTSDVGDLSRLAGLLPERVAVIGL